MKKIISLLCVCAMSLSLIACGGNTEDTKKDTVAQTSENVENETTSSDIVKKEPYKVVEAAQGQQIEIDAKYGTYRVSITKVEEVDWWYRKHQTNAKHVVVVHYEVENISFDSILSEGVELNPDSFRVTGNNDYQGKAFNTYYDGYAASGVVKPGETKSGTFAYELDNPNRKPDFYYVVFKNSSGDIAKVKCD